MKSLISSSLMPFMSTTLSLIGERPAASAASIPFSTLATSPPRVIMAKRSWRRESRLMFTRDKPACLSRAALAGSIRPLVVSDISSMPGIAAIMATSFSKSLRTRGSPPVSRILLNPRGASASTTAVISS
ncbi:hypothetical protein D3C75_969940 [compost metagenome]